MNELALDLLCWYSIGNTSGYSQCLDTRFDSGVEQ